MEKYILDALDKKILYFLALNSRTKISKIAKKTHCSVAKVSYRINNLIKNKVIVFFPTLINYRALGFNAISIDYRLKDLDQKTLDNLIEQISKIKNVADIIQVNGIYNLHVVLLEKNLSAASVSIWELRQLLSQHIISESISFYLSSIFFERKVFYNDIKLHSHPGLVAVEEPKKIFDLTKEQRSVLSILANNSTISTFELAKRLGCSAQKVFNIIKTLEENKIIRGYTIKINPALENYLYFRVLLKLKNITHDKRHTILNFLNEHPRVYRSIVMLGDYDLCYDVRCADLEQLSLILQDVYSNFPDEIIKQDWIQIYKIFKYTFYIDEET